MNKVEFLLVSLFETTVVNKNHRIPEDREYEKSGLYPKNGKPFRVWALLGWLTLLMISIAGTAALLNFILLS